jgi:hypothetical protein
MNTEARHLTTCWNGLWSSTVATFPRERIVVSKQRLTVDLNG